MDIFHENYFENCRRAVLDDSSRSGKKLQAWYAALSKCSARDYKELKQTFSTADYVPKKYTVFDVGGNAYRVIVVIHYNKQIAYIRAVLTHAEYDKWTRDNRGK